MAVRKLLLDMNLVSFGKTAVGVYHDEANLPSNSLVVVTPFLSVVHPEGQEVTPRSVGQHVPELVSLVC